jgi:hypothetical protein
MVQCILAVSSVAFFFFLQDEYELRISSDFGDNQLAKQCAGLGSAHALLERMQTIERSGKKRTIHLNYGQHNEEEEEKEEKPTSCELQKKKAKGNTVQSLSDLERPRVEFIGDSPTLMQSSCCALLCVLACSQTVCEECGESFPRSASRGKVCNACRKGKWKEDNENMMTEEEAAKEVAMEYFLTSETSSSSHLSFASSSSSSSAAAPHHLSAHGKVCVARICPK